MHKQLETLSGGIFLIGLGLLFLVPGLSFWPWILAVIGLSQLPAALSRKQGWYGLQGVFWMVGLALLFWSGFFWPGILILIGVATLVGALTKGTEGSPFSESESSDEISDDELPVASGDWATGPPAPDSTVENDARTGQSTSKLPTETDVQD